MDIGLATVYRVLTQFEQAGLLQRHHFDVSSMPVITTTISSALIVGRVEEFYDAEIERRQGKIAKERGFAIQEHALYLYAECVKSECPHRSKDSKGNSNHR